MGKKNKGMMIIGSIMLGLVTVLLVYVVLISTGVIVGREYTIKVEAISAEKEYDGTPLTLTDYRVVEGQEYLDKNGHHLEVNCVGNQTDAGTTIGHLDVSVFDSSNAEVTSRYNIVTIDGTITVNPRVITFKTYGKEMAYDGTTLDVSQLTTAYEQLSGEAVVGQHLSFQATGSQTEIGSCPVEITISAFDAENNPISASNYTIKYEGEQATLTVRPRYIYVTKQQDYTETYDGLPKNKTGYVTVIESRSELAEFNASVGQVSFSFSETNVGDYKIEDYNFKVTDKYGNDISQYFAIDPNSVLPYYYIKPIKGIFKTAGLTRYYDGTVLALEEYDHELLKIASADTAVIKWENSIINVGEIENTATLVIQNAQGVDVTSNYDFTTEYGLLKIVSRPITITTFDSTKPFDGLTLFGVEVKNENGENYQITAGTLVAGETIDVKLEASILEVGDILNKITSVTIKNKDNEDVTGNYDINKNEGNLSITKITIAIITSSQDWTYDGKEHNTESVGAQVQGLPETCSIVFNNWPTLLDATLDLETNEIYKVDNKPDYIVYDANNNIVYDSADSNKQENLQVTSENWGKLRIFPFDLTVETKGNLENPKTYDGAICSNHLVTVTGLQTSHVISYEWPSDRSSVTRDKYDQVISFENKPVVTIKDSTGRVITQNYRITYICGELKVIPADLYVTTYNVAKYYDGLPIIVDSDKYEVTGSFAEGDHIANVKTITDCVEVKKNGNDIGYYDNTITFIVVDKNNQDVTSNYNIVDASIGKLTINPITIKLTTGSGDFTYDATPHKVTDNYIVTDEYGNDIPSNFRYELTNFKEFTDVNLEEKASKKQNTCTANFYITIDGIEKSVDSKNVYIVEEYGEVNIHPIKIKAVANDKEKEYNGLPFTYNANEANNWYAIASVVDMNGNPVNLPTGHEIKMDEVEFAKLLNSFVNYKAGGYNYEPKLKVYVGESDTYNKNYTFEYVEGIITINKLNVIVTTAGYDEVIDMTYDDTEHQFTDGATVTYENGDALPSYFTFEFSDFRKFKEANEDKVDSYKENSCTVTFKINTGSGTTTAKDSNFNIIKHYGKVVVHKITIRVAAKNQNKDYDGLPFVYDNIPSNWLDLEHVVYYDYNDNKIEVSELPLGIELRIDGEALNSSISSITDVVSGGKEYEFTSKTLKVYKNDSDAINANFKVECAKGVIYIIPRSVLIRTIDGQFTYDGTVHTFEMGVEVTDLDGNPLPEIFSYTTSNFTKFSKVSQSGDENKCSVKFTVTINGRQSPSKNDNFAITEDFGEVTVHPIKVSVKLNDNIVKVYDGNPFVFNDGDDSQWYTITGYTKHDSTPVDLVAGHQISVDKEKFNATLSTIVNNNINGNEYTIDFVVMYGATDVTENYEFDCTKGIITINPMQLKLTTAGYNDPINISYDGYSHTFSDGTILTYSNGTALESKFKYTFTNFTTFKNVVSSEVGNNNCKVNLTIEKDGFDMPVNNNNYEIAIEELGIVNVHPIEIHLNLLNKQKTYDGKPFTFNVGDENEWYTLDHYEDFQGNIISIVPDDITLKIDSTLFNNLLKTKVDYNQNGYEYDIKINAYNNDNSTNKNYEFVYNPGTIIINKLKVLVYTQDDITYTYDGNAHQFTLNAMVKDENGFDLPENIIPVFSNFRSFVNANEDGKPADKENTCVVSFNIDNGNGFTKASDTNFTIEAHYGEIVIKKLTIKVTAKEQEKDYDGLPCVYDGVPSNWFELVGFFDHNNNEVEQPNGISLVIIASAFNNSINDITDVKKGGNDYSFTSNTLKVYKDGSDAVNSNYNVVSSQGKIYINPMKVKLTTESGIFTYDGTVHTFENNGIITDLDNNDLPAKFSYNLISFTEFIDVKDSGSNKCDVEFYITINGKTQKVENSNFNILSNYGNVNVQPMKVFVSGKTKEKTYDGDPFVFNDGDDNDWYTITKVTKYDGVTLSSILSSHTLSVNIEKFNTTLSSIVDCEDSGTKYEIDFIVTDTNSTDVTENYKFIYDNCTIKIKKLKIKLVTGSTDITYDGENHTYEENALVTNSNGTPLNSKFSYSLYDFKIFNNVNDSTSNENSCSINLWINSELVNTENYEVQTELGKVNVHPIVIYISCKNQTKTFDATPFVYTTGNDNDWFAITGYKNYAEEAVLPADELIIKVDEYTFNNTILKNKINYVDGGYDYQIVLKAYNTDNSINKNYDFSYEKGKLIINPMTIVVTTGSAEFTYDGENHTYEEDVIVVDGNGNVLDSNVFTYDLTNFTKFKDVNIAIDDSQKNSCDIKFYVYQNGIKTSSKDDNYDIQFIEGKVKIYPIKIYITAKNKEKTYDASPYIFTVGDDENWYEITRYEDKDENELVGLPNGCSVVIDSTLFNNELKKYVNYVLNGYEYSVECKVTKGGSDSVNSNFEFVYTKGVIKINRINVSITAKDQTKQYDGYPITYNSLEESSWHYAPTYTDHNGNVIELPANHNIRLDAVGLQTILNEFVDYKDGGYKYEIPFVAYNGEDPSVNGNYEFNCTEGKITITRINIDIYTEKTRLLDESHTLIKQYDGEPIVDNVIWLSQSDWNKLDAIGASTPEVVSATTFTNVQYNSNNEVIAIDNEIVIKIKVGDKDVTSNFIISYNTGKLKIEPVIVKVNSPTLTIQYDGLEHLYDDLTITNEGELGSFLTEVDGKKYTFSFENKNFNSFVDCAYDGTNKLSFYNNEGTFKLVVTNRDDVDVTSNFTYVFSPGKITINPRTILIHLDGDTKTFDGSPLTQTIWTYHTQSDEDFIIDLGQILTITATGSQLYVGKSNNTFTYIIKDSNDVDVSKNYIVTNLSEDTLEVEKLELEIISNSKSKIYDGLELVCHEILNSSDLEDDFASLAALGYEISYTFYGTQTEIGKSENTFTVKIKDADHNNLDVKNYSITYVYGFLEVLPYVTGTGNLAKQTATASDEIVSFTINATTKGVIYLRDRSYGDYVGTGWDYIPDYESDSYNANNILAKVLDDNGYLVHGKVTITSNNNLPYLMPYYGYSTDLFENLNGGDIHVSKSHSEPYEVEYYNYYYNLVNLSLSDVNYIDFEDNYYSYVNSTDTYLKIDATLKTRLIELANNNGITMGDSDLILKINEFIHDNYTYEYDEGRRNTNDIVNYFLFGENKKGTCQDFASATVLMYRAFGIPARYTTGFVCKVTDDNVGTDIDVTQDLAHAWVEIYIKGMGWINVEATNGMDMIISNGGAVSDEITGMVNKSGQLNNSDMPSPTHSTLFTINSDRAGSFYLRGYSMGNYNGTGFDEMDSINTYKDPDYNPLNYAAIILENEGYKHNYLTIDLTSQNYNGYLTPYFTSGDYTINDVSFSNDDTYLDGNYASPYMINYVYFDINRFNTNLGAYPTVTGDLVSEELAYRTYVYDNYLSMDGASTELLNEFYNLKLSKGWSKSKTTIISEIQNYIKSQIIYSMTFDYTSSTDMVYDILFVNKVGVCQHFAAAATMLYRYIGIPARWVCGAKTGVSKNEVGKNVAVKDDCLHSWVEVYLDGFGWCPIEVTGAMQGENAPNIPSSDAIEITLRPQEKHILYEDLSNPIDLNTIVGLPQNLVNQGYYVEGTVEAETMNLGSNVTKILTYTIYDGGHNNVTNEFDILLSNGKLQVYIDKITIKTSSDSKQYDGYDLTNHTLESITGTPKTGHTMNSGNIVYTGKATTPGINVANKITYNNLITDDATGYDVTDQYWIVVQTGQLLIVKRDITIIADSLELTISEYDELGGGDIYCDTYTVDGLAPGHYIYDITMDVDSYISDSQDYADNIIDSVTIYDENDNDVTNCYNIICEDGELWLY